MDGLFTIRRDSTTVMIADKKTRVLRVYFYAFVFFFYLSLDEKCVRMSAPVSETMIPFVRTAVPEKHGRQKEIGTAVYLSH